MWEQYVERIMRVKSSGSGQDKTPTFPLKLVIVLRVSSMEVSPVRFSYSLRSPYRPTGVHKDQGAFAEYVKADAAITWKIPDSISYEEAVTVSVGVLTCIQAMFHPKRLGLVQYPNQVPDQPWVRVFSPSPFSRSTSSALANCTRVSHPRF